MKLTATDTLTIDAESITKVSESYRYAVSSSSAIPSTGWVTTRPDVSQGQWLHTEITILWSDGSTTTMYESERNPVDGHAPQQVFKQVATYSTPSTPSGDSPRGWSFDPVGVSQTYPYEYRSSRSWDGTGWGNWTTPVLNARWSSDGNSISILGEAIGVIDWGGQIPSGTPSVGDTYLHNDNAGVDYEVYEVDPSDPTAGFWEPYNCSLGEGFLVSGYLWVKVRTSSSATLPRWKNVGLIQGPQGPKGDTGDQGPTGPKGDNAPYDINTYTRSSSRSNWSASDISGIWQDTIPSPTNDYPYIWQRTIHYDKNGVAGTPSYVCLTGPQGNVGSIGKMCYITGEYDSTIEYKSDSQQTVAVEVPNGSVVELYYLVASSNVVNGQHFGPTDSTGYWEKGMNNYNLFRTKYLFANFANLGSFIVSGDWLFSASGTINGTHYDYDDDYTYGNVTKRAYMWFDPERIEQTTNTNFVPVFAVDGKTGKSYQSEAHISGVVKASSFFNKWNSSVSAGDTIDPADGSGVIIPLGYTSTIYLPDATDNEGLTLSMIHIEEEITRSWPGLCKIYANGTDVILVRTSQSSSSITEYYGVKGVRIPLNTLAKFHSIGGFWVLECDETDVDFFAS